MISIILPKIMKPTACYSKMFDYNLQQIYLCKKKEKIEKENF